MAGGAGLRGPLGNLRNLRRLPVRSGSHRRLVDRGLIAARPSAVRDGRQPIKLRRVAAITGAGLLAGSASVAAVTAVSAPPAAADTAPYTAACTSGFLGSFTAAGVVTTGTLSAEPVAPGGSETLNGYGLAITIPASVVNTAIADGVTSLTGSIATAIDATNITPSSTAETLAASTGPLTADTPLALTTGPPAVPPSFTDAAPGGVVHVTQAAAISITFDAQVDGITLPLQVDVSCTATPADIDTAAIVSPVAPQISSGSRDTVPAGSAFSYTVTSNRTPTPVSGASARRQPLTTAHPRDRPHRNQQDARTAGLHLTGKGQTLARSVLTARKEMTARLSAG